MLARLSFGWQQCHAQVNTPPRTEVGLRELKHQADGSVVGEHVHHLLQERVSASSSATHTVVWLGTDLDDVGVAQLAQ